MDKIIEDTNVGKPEVVVMTTEDRIGTPTSQDSLLKNRLVRLTIGSPLSFIKYVRLNVLLVRLFVRSVGSSASLSHLIIYQISIHLTVGTTFPRKILNNGKEPCEPLMQRSRQKQFQRGHSFDGRKSVNGNLRSARIYSDVRSGRRKGVATIALLPA